MSSDKTQNLLNAVKTLWPIAVALCGVVLAWGYMSRDQHYIGEKAHNALIKTTEIERTVNKHEVSLSAHDSILQQHDTRIRLQEQTSRDVAEMKGDIKLLLERTSRQ